MEEVKFKHFCIYLITNTKNQKLYIGQTDNPKRRWSHHKSDAKCGRQCAINRAIRKYGVEFFKFEIIEDLGITIQEEVNNAEMFWIQYLESFRYDSGYNTRMGGNTSTFTSETRKKMSEAQKNSKYVRPSKYTWPNDDELVALINKLGYVGATKHLGIEKRSAIHNRVWRNKLKPLITLPKQIYHGKTPSVLDWPNDANLFQEIKKRGYFAVASSLQCTVKQLYNRVSKRGLGPINPEILTKVLGENQSTAVLKSEHVINIVNLYFTGNYSFQALGRKFNVSKTTIGSIIDGKLWSHITGIKPGISIRRAKYSWPNNDELVAMINSLGYVGTSIHLGIKTNTIHSRIRYKELVVSPPQIFNWPEDDELVVMCRKQGYEAVANSLKCTVNQLLTRIEYRKLGPINPEIRRNKVGENSPAAKLTASQVLEIVKLYSTGNYSHRDLGKQFSVDKSIIGDIVNGKTWRSITGLEKKTDLTGNTILNERQVLDIVKLRKLGHSLKELAEQFGVKIGTISSITGGHTWSHITGITPKSRKPKS